MKASGSPQIRGMVILFPGVFTVSTIEGYVERDLS